MEERTDADEGWTRTQQRQSQERRTTEMSAAESRAPQISERARIEDLPKPDLDPSPLPSGLVRRHPPVPPPLPPRDDGEGNPPPHGEGRGECGGPGGRATPHPQTWWAAAATSPPPAGSPPFPVERPRWRSPPSMSPSACAAPSPIHPLPTFPLPPPPRWGDAHRPDASDDGNRIRAPRSPSPSPSPSPRAGARRGYPMGGSPQAGRRGIDGGRRRNLARNSSEPSVASFLLARKAVGHGAADSASQRSGGEPGGEAVAPARHPLATTSVRAAQHGADGRASAAPRTAAEEGVPPPAKRDARAVRQNLAAARFDPASPAADLFLRAMADCEGERGPPARRDRGKGGSAISLSAPPPPSLPPPVDDRRGPTSSHAPKRHDDKGKDKVLRREPRRSAAINADEGAGEPHAGDDDEWRAAAEAERAAEENEDRSEDDADDPETDDRPFCRHWKLGRCHLPAHMRRYRHEPPDAMPFVSVHKTKLPRANTLYFHHPPPAARKRKVIAIIIACYNEQWDELHRTLCSLSRQRSPIVDARGRPKSYEHRIVLIFDGIERMSTSMKAYLCSMFRSESDDLQRVLYDEADRMLRTIKAGSGDGAPAHGTVSRHVNFITQNRTIRLGVGDRNEIAFTAVDHPDELQPGDLNVSLLLKLDNRQKHNSHEWGFLAFARDVGATYVFASDVGTLYAKKCLYRLARYLDTHKKVSAVTGRQRVMSVGQQKSDELWYSLARWYRAAQRYDYESSFASFMAAFHLVGMLPVIPGPCGLSRYSDMRGEAWKWYFETVHTPPEEQDIILGNLLLAEDRVLCYAAALKTEKPRYTAIEPSATFYFAAETELKTLAFQRRRWINGTVMGYIYLGLLNPGLIFRSKHCFLLKPVMWALIMCQLLMFLVVALSPGLFLISLRLSLETVRPLVGADSSIYTDVLWGIAVVSYIAFVIRHRYVNFEAALFYWMVFLNVCTVALAFGMTARAIAQQEIPDFWVNPLDARALTYYLVMLVGFCTLFPIFIALFTGGISAYYMLTTILPFYLFLPTLVSTFGAYAFARTYDLSWGNRPPSELREEDGIDAAKRLAVEKARTKLREQSQASCAFIVMLNIVLVCLVLMTVQVGWVIIGIAACVFFASFVQMIISFVWFFRFFVMWCLRQVWLACCCLFCCKWRAWCCCWWCDACRRRKLAKAVLDADFLA